MQFFVRRLDTVSCKIYFDVLQFYEFYKNGFDKNQIFN